MTWFRVDDGFFEDPKFEALEAMGPAKLQAAITVWCVMGADCARRLTDGKVTRERLQKVLGGTMGKLAAVGAQALVDARDPTTGAALWSVDDSGWSFVNWDKYQPTRNEVVDARKARAERQKRWRERRDSNASTNASYDSKRDGLRDASTNASKDAAPARALPGPARPGPAQERESARGAPPTAVVTGAYRQEFCDLVGTRCSARGRARPMGTRDQETRAVEHARELAKLHGVTFAEAVERLADKALDEDPTGKQFPFLLLSLDPFANGSRPAIIPVDKRRALDTPEGV